ncbi:MAG: c-type cytochrome [Chromatiales bacterium]|nr:c-type cytochrome [Gammaproteobacteria bacterium]MCP5352369.1 c-type cytochrome [Chromatiales bacterium]
MNRFFSLPMRPTLLTLLVLAIPTGVLGADLPGGATTNTTKLGPHAYSEPAANLSLADTLDFKVGRGFFERIWVTAPSSTEAADGLGPLYNARACNQCHPRNGRGHAPSDPSENPVSLVAHLSIPGGDRSPRPIPEPVYGAQLQTFAVPGLAAEGRLAVRYEPIELALNGETVELRRPDYRIVDTAYGAPHADLRLSPRVSPPLIGLGLLELIPEAALRAQADPDDTDADGISGRPNEVWSTSLGRIAPGRFGWKAGHATIDDQNQAAFRNDIGLSTPQHPAGSGDCTASQTACLELPDGNSPQYESLEVHTVITNLVRDYVHNLAPPAGQTHDPEAIGHGKTLFHDAGCAACHTPHWRTAPSADRPHLGGQDIWPYTDMLLHDMGEGLADHRPEALADGREWRTAPLWGIGRSATVSGHSGFLHDGRARSLLEAVLWHGGEAGTARDRVIAMPPQQRQRLIGFLESL